MAIFLFVEARCRPQSSMAQFGLRSDDAVASNLHAEGIHMPMQTKPLNMTFTYALTSANAALNNNVLCTLTSVQQQRHFTIQLNNLTAGIN